MKVLPLHYSLYKQSDLVANLFDHSVLMSKKKNRSTHYKIVMHMKLELVITCLGGRFEINCSSVFLKILKLLE